MTDVGESTVGGRLSLLMGRSRSSSSWLEVMSHFYPAVGRLPFFILLFASLLGPFYLYDLLCQYINCCWRPCEECVVPLKQIIYLQETETMKACLMKSPLISINEVSMKKCVACNCVCIAWRKRLFVWIISGLLKILLHL